MKRIYEGKNERGEGSTRINDFLIYFGDIFSKGKLFY
jgi:hypothetical protein